MAWSFEFVSGFILYLTHFTLSFLNAPAGQIWLWVCFIDICFNFIFLPIIYIFNNEVNKQRIIAKCWDKWLRQSFNVHSMVEPQAEVVEFPVAPNPNLNPPPSNMIPTISETVDNDFSQDDEVARQVSAELREETDNVQLDGASFNVIAEVRERETGPYNDLSPDDELVRQANSEHSEGGDNVERYDASFNGIVNGSYLNFTSLENVEAEANEEDTGLEIFVLDDLSKRQNNLAPSDTSITKRCNTWLDK